MKKTSLLLLVALTFSLFACTSSTEKTAEQNPTKEQNKTQTEYWKDLHRSGQWFEGSLNGQPIWAYLARLEKNKDGSYRYKLHYGQQGKVFSLSGEGSASDMRLKSGDEAQKMTLSLSGDQLSGEDGQGAKVQLAGKSHEKYTQLSDLLANLAQLQLPLKTDYHKGLAVASLLNNYAEKKNFGLAVPNLKSLLGAKGDILKQDAAVVWGKIPQADGQSLLLYTAAEVQEAACPEIMDDQQIVSPEQMLTLALIAKDGSCIWNAALGNLPLIFENYVNLELNISSPNSIQLKWDSNIPSMQGQPADETFKQSFSISPQGLTAL